MTQRDSNLDPFDFAAESAPNVTGPKRGSGWALVWVIVVLLGAGAAYLWFFDRERANRWLEKAPTITGPSVTTAYKWRDANGSWQITDQPPPGAIPYETVRVRSDVNILPALEEEKR
ncbi:MAG: DUF4124 domain-containing protein [Gammaproteobacteria bacterium]|nr:DUF4124 domain-containing protein [Gammaproteobacteria bacterium]